MDVLVTFKYDVSSMTNLRRPVRLRNVFLTFRKPNNTLNGHVLITCERRFQNVRKTFYIYVLDVFGLSRCPFEVLLQDVLGGNVFHTLSERVRLRCCFSFPNV